MKKKQRKTPWSPFNIQRREQLLQAMPSCGWDIAKAAIAAGYSNQYARKRIKDVIKNNVEFCDRIIQLRRETEATSQDDVELVKKTMRNIINDPNSRRADLIKACDVLCKIAGVYSERRQIEDVTRQRELDAAEQHEAALLATLRLRLPAYAPMVTLPNIIDAVTLQAENRVCVTQTGPDTQGNGIETTPKQGGRNGQDAPLQALLTNGQDGDGETVTPQAALGAPFPSSPR